jgi:hypothetical protein
MGNVTNTNVLLTNEAATKEPLTAEVLTPVVQFNRRVRKQSTALIALMVRAGIAEADADCAVDLSSKFSRGSEPPLMEEHHYLGCEQPVGEHLGVGFVSLTEALDLTTPAGRAMAGLLAVFAAFEREILAERTRAELAHARQNGQRLGGPQR